MWKWIDGYWGEDAYFSDLDDFGAIGQISYPADRFLDSVHLLVKTNDWEQQTADFQIRRFLGDSPNHIWLVEGDQQVYYSKQVALTSPFLSKPHDSAFDMAIRSQDFDYKWGFQGWLGYQHQEEQTQFRLWSPLAHRVELLLFDQNLEVSASYNMARGQDVNFDNHQMNTHGVWFATLDGDWSGYSYLYRVYHEKDYYQDSCDPYTIALSLDQKKSLILSEADRHSDRVVDASQATWRLENPCSAVICEMHIRDLTKSEISGIAEHLRGTFLGACQTGSKNAHGHSTAFDHIKKMGYTHVQLQPIFEHHKTYDWQGEIAYNWGYDPEHYNVPDRQFVSDKSNPLAPIHELKEMIASYHEAGIGVIMDVVYNHSYSSYSSPFQLTMPSYYYRMNPDGSFQDGSGCGNETASEKEMYRKYMIDSVTYWAEEFGIDGFRFDLMGLHDVTTMNAIRQALDNIDTRILIYGEGWDMGTGLASHDKAMKSNANQMPRIGFFNDNGRDAVKGAEVYGSLKAGFVSGAPLEWEIGQALKASRVFAPYLSPGQVVNYIEAHDNYNLNDLLTVLHPDDSQEQRRQRILLANALNLSMQGMAFMQIGQEFMRSKISASGDNGQVTWEDMNYAMNSYNAPDRVNSIDWNQVSNERDLIEAVAKWISMKKNFPEFSKKSFTSIEKTVILEEYSYESGQVGLAFKDEKISKIIFNNIEKTVKIY
ncbi:type I pullulanase [Streptococcus loxodontisalivarius]|nr:type I pullulanase [Streptococcus loxodontisalivarius]